MSESTFTIRERHKKMTVSATSSTTTSTSSTSSSTASATAQADKFLKILLVELQNQNPLDAVDTKDFTTQLAQYSSLEQQIDTNTKLDNLISALGNTSTSNLSPTSYLGNVVDVDSKTTVVQNGEANWSYSSDGATAIKITVTDASGNVVYTGDGDATSGTHVFTLSASSTTANGTPLTVSMIASDENGDVTTAPTVNARVQVDAVDSSSGTTLLEAAGYSFKASSVTRVATPSTTSNTSSTSSTDSTSSTGTSS